MSKCDKCNKRPVRGEGTYCMRCLSGYSVEDPTWVKVRDFLTGLLVISGIVITILYGGLLY